MSRHGFALLLATTVSLNLAHAQTTSGLIAPPQARVAQPAAPATTKAGSGEEASDVKAALAAAIAAGDVCRAIPLGASARDIFETRRAGLPAQLRDRQYDAVEYIRTPQGALAIGFKGPNGGGSLGMGNAQLPGGTAGLQTYAEFAPTPPARPPSPEQLALAQRVVAGLSAEEAAKALLALRPPPPGTPTYDPATARYVRGSNGVLELTMTSPNGYMLAPLPGAESYPGLANLPLDRDAVINPALEASRRQAEARAQNPPAPIVVAGPPPLPPIRCD